MSKNTIQIPKEIFESIFFQDGGQKKLNKSLTGSYQYGIDPSKPYIEPNAEVEKGEYIKDSQGIREVEGNKHRDGGVQVRLEDYSKVLSDHLKVGEEVVKEIKEVFGIKVSKNDTYSKVLDKVFDKLGLTKIIKEQEEVIAKINKQQQETKDAQTLSLNTEVLSAKINELEEEKRPKEGEASKVFDYLFQKQEQSKEEIAGTGEDYYRDGGGYYGGPPAPNFFLYPTGYPQPQIVSSNHRQVLAPQVNLFDPTWYDPMRPRVETPQVNLFDPTWYDPMRSRAGTPQVSPTVSGASQQVQAQDNVITIADDQLPETTNQQTTAAQTTATPTEQAQQQEVYSLGIVNPLIRDEYIVSQSLTGASGPRGVYGSQIDKGEATAHTSTILPSIYEAHFDKGSITPRDVLDYQAAYNRFSYEAGDALKEFYGEDSEEYLKAIKFLEDNRFTDNKDEVRGKDNKYGNFASTRPSIAVKMIPQEELDKLKEEGINTVGQLRARHPEIYNKYSKGVDFPDDVWLGPLGTESTTTKPTTTEDEPQPTGTAEERGSLGTDQGRQDRQGVFLAPDQTPLPPDSLEAHLKTTRRYERLDYQDVSPEQQLVELNKQVERSENNLDMMPPQQRAAISANMLATQTDATNQILQQTQQINQQGRQQIENTNAQIQMQENIANAQDALNYEQRQLMAQARTDADLRSFYNTLQRNNLMNFNTINSLNLSNALYDNFQFTDRGIESKGAAPQWLVNWWNQNTKDMTKKEQQEFYKNMVGNQNLG